MNPSPLILLLLSLLILQGSGCGRSPRTTYYTLLSPPAVAATDFLPAYVVAVGPVTVPDLFDRPNLVVRSGAHIRDILETHRWAEPLPDGIAGAFAQDLADLLRPARIMVMTGNSGAADHRVKLHVQQWEAIPGEGVTIDVIWTLAGNGNRREKTGRRVVMVPCDGPGYEPLVAAASRALAVVAKDVAAFLPDPRVEEPTAAADKSPNGGERKMDVGK